MNRGFVKLHVLCTVAICTVVVTRMWSVYCITLWGKVGVLFMNRGYVGDMCRCNRHHEWIMLGTLTLIYCFQCMINQG